MKPLARVDQLNIEPLKDETLVYDLNTNKAHCLNRTAAAVWKLCDGRTTPASMTEQLRQQLDASIDESVVNSALQELAKAQLLEAEVEPTAFGPLLSRREMSIRAGLLLPVVASVLVPTPAAAASGGPPTTLPPAPPSAGMGGH